MKKRLLSLLLCLVMVFSLFPFAASAEGNRGVYEVGDTDSATYTFKVGDETVSTQIVLAGGTLTEPSAPTVDADQEFQGWYVGTEELVFDANGQHTVDAIDGDVTVTAKIVDLYRVTFKNEDNTKVVTVKSVARGESIDFSDIHYDVSSSAGTRAVVGWSTSETGNELANPYTPTADVTLYPVIRDGNWLKFDENDGDASGIAGASYTPAQFLTSGQTPTVPDEPTRMGYSFGGWYTDAACTTPYNFTAISGPTTVYAKWNPDNADYTIIIWKQRVTDDWNADDANKHWDYEVSIPLKADVGSPVNVADIYKGYGDNNNVQINGKTYDFMGFQYYKCDDAKTVAADGSTILNVYYTRRVITITFNPAASNGWKIDSILPPYGHNYYYYIETNGHEVSTENTTTADNKLYAGKAVYKGLYGAELTFAWPTAYYELRDRLVFSDQWNSHGNTLWHYGNTDLSFLGNFILPDKEDSNITLTFTESGDNPIKFYKQSVDGNSWDLARTVYMDGGNGFGITDKFEGFTAYKYVITSRNAGYPAESQWKSAVGSNGKYVTTESFNNRDLHIFFQRNSYNIDFEYTNGTTARDTVVKKYQAPLNDVSEAEPAYPSFLPAGEYEFVGWFADPELTTYVSFQEISDAKKAELTNYYGIVSFLSFAGQTMPTNNIVLYAGYFKIGFDCALDANGGAFDQNTQAGVFWVEINSQIDSVISEHVSRDGYSIAGWQVSTVDGELLGVSRSGPNNYRYVGDFSNWTVTDERYDFSKQVKAPVYLTAKWISNATLSVEYDLNGGTGSITDGNAYLDGADVALTGTAPVKSGSHFIGWQVEGEEDVLLPGAALELNKANQDVDNNNKVKLTAVYIPVEEVTLSFDAGTDATVSPESVTLQKNEAYDLSGVTVTAAGKTFIGWSKEADNTVEFQPDAVVATDCDATLYAVYEGKSTYVIDFNAPMIVATGATEMKDETDHNGAFNLNTSSKEVTYQLSTQALSSKTAVINKAYTEADTAKVFGTPVNGKGVANAWNQITAVPASAIYFSDTLADKTLTANDQIGYNAGVTYPDPSKTTGTYTFTFTGSRIDVYCTTMDSSGTVTAKLTKSDGSTQTKFVKMTVPEAGTTRVSAPSVSFSGLSGTSTLTIIATDKANFKLEGVRVYNASELTDANEPNARYINLRDMILGKAAASELTNETTGALFFDGYNEETGWNINDYTNNGPKNEVYLTAGQAVAFQVPANTNVMVSMRAPEANSGTAKVNNDAANKITVSNVDMYYPVSVDAEDNSVLITNDGPATISILNVKLTGAAPAEPGRTLMASPKLFSFAARVMTAEEPQETTAPVETSAPQESPAPAETNEPTNVPSVHSIIQQLFSSFVNRLFGSMSRLFGR